jgi:hypothetical protein
MSRLRSVSEYSRDAALAFCLVASATACDIVSSNESVWVEDFGVELAEDREWTYRLTLHQFGDEIGGHVEFFRIDGACNSRTAPFFCAEDCAYFGPGLERGGEFRISVIAPDDTQLIMQVRRASRRQLVTRVIEAESPENVLEFPMAIDGVSQVSAACPDREAALQQSADTGLGADL